MGEGGPGVGVLSLRTVDTDDFMLPLRRRGKLPYLFMLYVTFGSDILRVRGTKLSSVGYIGVWSTAFPYLLRGNKM